ncbi:uncharacterized protein LOC126680365 [Mercurialis annua]|uniref:uncharacterized protein LOC126680365 n=1 Tax=Mercurialis annua TaxID=3986 RepID=UPI0024ADBDF7|nr:uncharacterized protein LOC126680365 [Mercurialis annua]
MMNQVYPHWRFVVKTLPRNLYNMSLESEKDADVEAEWSHMEYSLGENSNCYVVEAEDVKYPVVRTDIEPEVIDHIHITELKEKVRQYKKKIRKWRMWWRKRGKRKTKKTKKKKEMTSMKKKNKKMIIIQMAVEMNSSSGLDGASRSDKENQFEKAKRGKTRGAKWKKKRDLEKTRVHIDIPPCLQRVVGPNAQQFITETSYHY